MTIPNINELGRQQTRALVVKFDQQIAGNLSGEQSAQSMIDLQVLINKRNEAYEQLAAMLRKQQQALNSVVDNMR